MSTSLLRAAAGFAALGALVAAPASASAAPVPFPCGYSSQGMDAHYRHCANTFALIHVDWDTGSHYTDCYGPWDEQTLWHDGPHRQVNAYFVNTPPRLLKNSSGNWICSASQPDA
ncbi:DUF6355 family natural product biosynthesis protein [Amycolatopsis sp. NPDC003865]